MGERGEKGGGGELATSSTVDEGEGGIQPDALLVESKGGVGGKDWCNGKKYEKRTG